MKGVGRPENIHKQGLDGYLRMKERKLPVGNCFSAIMGGNRDRTRGECGKMIGERKK
jgi:hypothetical protein